MVPEIGQNALNYLTVKNSIIVRKAKQCGMQQVESQFKTQSQYYT